jgi:hypothetical protein
MASRERVEALIKEHFSRRPLMRATDAYKLLYQGVFGVGHIMSDSAWEHLEEEAGRIEIYDHPWEPLIEDVSADGSMVRVNLRPYLRKSLLLDNLFEAMKESAKGEGAPKDFLFAWMVFRELAETGTVQVDQNETEELDAELNEKGCRPHHHSEVYREAYYPAYRVVRREILSKYLKIPES